SSRSSSCALFPEWPLGAIRQAHIMAIIFASIDLWIMAECRRCIGAGRSASVAVKIEAVSVDIFHSELAQTPGLLLERFNDSSATRAQFFVSRVDVRRKYPVNSRFEGAASSAKENRDVIARDGADIAAWI